MARRKVETVVHVSRPELGTGEIGEIIKGEPPVAQVYWPEVDKYGHYLVTDLRRTSKRDLVGELLATEDS
jgi:hypothetical protein